MKAPLFIRALKPEERQCLEAGLRSKEAFVFRRCQILLASARGQKPSQIASHLGCATQTVRNALNAFTHKGLAALIVGSSRPKTTHPILGEEKTEGVKALLHQSPRTFGKPRSLWTLELLAEVLFEQGETPKRLTKEAIRQALKRMSIPWKRAKHWITSPDPAYARKKGRFSD